MHWFEETFVSAEESRFRKQKVFWERQMDDIFCLSKYQNKLLILLSENLKLLSSFTTDLYFILYFIQSILRNNIDITILYNK